MSLLIIARSHIPIITPSSDSDRQRSKACYTRLCFSPSDQFACPTVSFVASFPFLAIPMMISSSGEIVSSWCTRQATPLRKETANTSILPSGSARSLDKTKNEDSYLMAVCTFPEKKRLYFIIFYTFDIISRNEEITDCAKINIHSPLLTLQMFWGIL